KNNWPSPFRSRARFLGHCQLLLDFPPKKIGRTPKISFRKNGSPRERDTGETMEAIVFEARTDERGPMAIPREFQRVFGKKAG
ncbi:MAG: hypothetical protein ACLFQQ_20220, partial [Desulfococcaceae bacterium]